MGFTILIRTLISVTCGYDEAVIDAMIMSVAKANRLVRLKHRSHDLHLVSDFSRGVHGTALIRARYRN